MNIAFIIKVQHPSYKIHERNECCTKQHNSSWLVVRMEKWKKNKNSFFNELDKQEPKKNSIKASKWEIQMKDQKVSTMKNMFKLN